MKIGVLGWKPGEAETVGIAVAARQRGHDAVVFGFEDINCAASPDGTRPHIGDDDAREYDVVISRGHVSAGSWPADVERLRLLCDVPGLLVLDPVDTHLGAVQKLAMLHRLTLAGVPVPPTATCRSLADVESAAARWGGIVLKPPMGFRGIDVERFPEGLTEQARTQVEWLLAQHTTLLCQPYYLHEGDLRVLVIDDRAALSTRYLTGGETWKPFPGRGGWPDGSEMKLEDIDPDPGLVATAVRAARATGLSMAGIDIIEHDGAYLVIEANVCPGWGMHPQNVQHRIAAEVVTLVERAHREAREEACG
jgi:ribosomal protein S6--L-glutamate ligase